MQKEHFSHFFLLPPCLYSIVSSYDCTWCEFFVPCVLFTSMTISFEQYEEYVNDACCSLKIIIQQDIFTLILAICNNSKISTTIKQFSLVSLEICSSKRILAQELLFYSFLCFEVSSQNLLVYIVNWQRIRLMFSIH